MKSTKKITSIVLALMMLVISVAGLVTVNASTGGTLSDYCTANNGSANNSSADNGSA